ncbi:MAG: hypothetical protein QOJ42_3133 [Acidobacteriaceae bacterium]|nr:hypothetical protein [Acidobacteriaceae bacterium]
MQSNAEDHPAPRARKAACIPAFSHFRRFPEISRIAAIWRHRRAAKTIAVVCVLGFEWRGQ